MDFDQIKTFLAVVECKTFSKASEELLVTQPTVTTRIRNLEDELGCKLFKRKNGTFQLTNEGELFLKYSIIIKKQLHNVKDEINIGNKPNLRVGFPPSISSKIISKTLNYIDFKKTYISLFKGNDSDQLTQLVLNDELDLAFVHKSISHSDLCIEKIANHKLVFLISPLHSLAKESKINEEMLHGENLICYQRDTPLWVGIEEVLQNIQLNRIEVHDLDILKKIVIDGWGFTILPTYTIGADFNKLVIKDFTAINEFPVQLSAIYKKDIIINNCISEYINAFKKEFTNPSILRNQKI